MAGRFSAFTCAQEPRWSRQDRRPLAACPHGSLSSAMAVPHSESRRRKAAASVVSTLLAASKALIDVASGAGAGPLEGPTGVEAPGMAEGAGSADGEGAGDCAVTGSGAPAAESAGAATCARLREACRGEYFVCPCCLATQPAPARPTSPQH